MEKGEPMEERGVRMDRKLGMWFWERVRRAAVGGLTVLAAVFVLMVFRIETAWGEDDGKAHGALRVEGTDLVDSKGEKVQLYGMSTHGIGWFPQYVSKETFRTLRDDWGCNCVRIAMYTDEYNGYCSGGNKEELKRLVENGVSYATELGMYVIVDWHVLNDRNPNVYGAEAEKFFDEMAGKWKDQDNVIYEICNEPNSGVTWEEIKEYAERIIPVIRKHDSDAVIIVGTPTWSQEVDQALKSPLDYGNVMYALHFYAGTHTDWLRSRAEECVKQGLPLFISEFGMCNASGNGANDFEQAEKWMELIVNSIQRIMYKQECSVCGFGQKKKRLLIRTFS